MQYKNKKGKSTMLNEKSLGVSVFLLAFFFSTLSAQTFYVKTVNGNQTAYALSILQKLSFSSGNLTVTKTDNSNGVYALSGLRYLNFKDLTTHLAEQLLVQEQTFMAYPNPATNVLNINLPGAASPRGTLNILNLEGKTILTQLVTGEGQIFIDISHLPQGFYLCRYNNGTEIKTIKIIKQ
jgi:hypothetical protein